MKDYEKVFISVRLNMNNPEHRMIQNVMNSIDMDLFKSKNRFVIAAILYYIENYGKENICEPPKEKKKPVFSDELADLKKEVLQECKMEAKNEVIACMGRLLAGMQSAAIQTGHQAEHGDADMPEMSPEDDEVITNLAMSWMTGGIE